MSIMAQFSVAFRLTHPPSGAKLPARFYWSFMFGTIRRHQNWLWIVITAVIVISFVMFFSPDVKFGRGGARSRPAPSEHGSTDGHPITVKDFIPAYHEARVNHCFRTGQLPCNKESSHATPNRQA